MCEFFYRETIYHSWPAGIVTEYDKVFFLRKKRLTVKRNDKQGNSHYLFSLEYLHIPMKVRNFSGFIYSCLTDRTWIFPVDLLARFA